MKAVIQWNGGGEKVITDSKLGDPRVAEFLDLLAELKAQGVTLTFEDDCTPPSRQGSNETREGE